jgi:hypothetical protein
MPVRSKYYKVSNEEFIAAVKVSFSIRETLRKLGMNAVGAAYKAFRTRVIELKVDTSHFLGSGHLKGKTHSWSPTKPLEEVLVENSARSPSGLKSRLVKVGLLKYHCYECGISEWNGKKLSLQLDHINGVNNDHRIDNLRLLCPNCHSLTPTFAGKNIPKSDEAAGDIVEFKKPRHPSFKEPKNCAECKVQLKSGAHTVCGKCYDLHRSKYQSKVHIKTKIDWPTNEELQCMLATSNYVQLGKKLGVSDNAIRKRMKLKS